MMKQKSKNEDILMKSAALALSSILLVFSATQSTFGYYNDSETSEGNIFSAAELDLVLSKNEILGTLGPAFVDEIHFDTQLLFTINSLSAQYITRVEFMGGDAGFCNALTLEASGGGFGGGFYDGPLTDFSAPTSTSFGTWEFDLELDTNISNFPHGAACDVDIVFDGWREDVSEKPESGYTDEERVEIRLTAGMVVLNEFLPNPEGEAYGFDFGDDHSDMPQGEWVELYNNSDFAADLGGWYVWDGSGSESNKIALTASNTQPASTVIGAHDWLVVYMNKAVLNNTGDTVALYNGDDTLIDSHIYTSHDWCEHEPTPEDPNAIGVAGGACSDVPPNKSYARIPDGIGSWVDPIPTPGNYNVLDTGAPMVESIQSTETIQSEPAPTSTTSTSTDTEVEKVTTSEPASIVDEAGTSTEEILSESGEIEETVLEDTEAKAASTTDTNIDETEDVPPAVEEKSGDQTEEEDSETPTGEAEVNTEDVITEEEQEPMKEPDPIDEGDEEETDEGGSDGEGVFVDEEIDPDQML